MFINRHFSGGSSMRRSNTSQKDRIIYNDGRPIDKRTLTFRTINLAFSLSSQSLPGELHRSFSRNPPWRQLGLYAEATGEPTLVTMTLSAIAIVLVVLMVTVGAHSQRHHQNSVTEKATRPLHSMLRKDI